MNWYLEVTYNFFFALARWLFLFVVTVVVVRLSQLMDYFLTCHRIRMKKRIYFFFFKIKFFSEIMGDGVQWEKRCYTKVYARVV